MSEEACSILLATVVVRLGKKSVVYVTSVPLQEPEEELNKLHLKKVSNNPSTSAASSD